LSQRRTLSANAVNYEGTNTYLTRGAGLTGSVDSKLLTAFEDDRL